MQFTARIRTLTTQSLEVPIIAESIRDALKEANTACNAMRRSVVDAVLLGLDDQNGKPLLQPQPNDLPKGWSEVIWRHRFPTADAEEAACLARISQADPDSPLMVYEVRGADGSFQKVNLEATSAMH